MRSRVSIEQGRQNATLSGKKMRHWRWNYRRRKCLRRLLWGWRDVRIANDIGVHRNSIRAWKRRPEFLAELCRVARDNAMTTRFRRMYETGVILDNLAVHTARAIKQYSKRKAISQLDINAIRTIGHEYLSLRRHEDIDFAVISKISNEFSKNYPEAELENLRLFKLFLGDNRDDNGTT